MRLLIVRFFQPNGYTLSGEVSWEGDQSGDTGVIHVDDNRVESVNDSITISGPGAANLTVNGNTDSRVFHVGPGKTVTISALTIINGNANGERKEKP